MLVLTALFFLLTLMPRQIGSCPAVLTRQGGYMLGKGLKNEFSENNQ